MRSFSRRLLFPFIFCLIAVSSAFAVGLDPSFGTTGKVYTSVPNDAAFGRSALLTQPDGKILVAGYRRNGPNQPSPQLIRYNSDGTLDSTFGTGGIMYWGFQFPLNTVEAAVLQSDGKIVMVGSGTIGLHAFRVLADGTPDPAFGSAGHAGVSVSGGSTAYCVLIQAGGKIVLGGTTTSGSVTLARLNTDGTVDNGFGPNGNGTVIGPSGAATSIVQQSTGKLVINLSFDVNDQSPSWGNSDMAAARFSADGVLDASFGAAGVAKLDFGHGERANAIAVQADDKIVAVGATRFNVYNVNETAAAWAIARFNSDGTTDSGFGNSGKVTLDLVYRGSEYANTVAMQPDGHILVAGTIVARFNSDGTLAGKTDGSSVHDPNRLDSTIRGLAVQPDGKILAVGYTGNNFGSNVALARYIDITSINNSTLFYDFDGDRRTDLSVYRAGATAGADSYWYGYWSTNISVGFPDDHFFSPKFGLRQDIPVPADYNGDGRTDFAVFRPSNGTWYSSNSYSADLSANFTSVQWGQAGDIPAPGDFDGDGIFDRAVFRPSTGAWYILKSTGGYIATQFGISGDKPVAADYDNDGRADLAVVRDIGGQLYWFILQSSNNAFVAIPFGVTGDRLAPTDYDGDGRAEIAVFRGSTGAWYLLRNYTTFSATFFGATGDVPAPADYDGDGINDYAVFRPSNQGYYIRNSRDGSLTSQQFGISTDLPLASAYVR